MQIVSINNKIQGGTPCISGTRVPVVEVVYLNKKKGLSPEEIATKHYIQLSLYQIQKALAWYERNKGRYGELDL